MTYKDIIKLIPTIQAAQLVGENIKAVKKTTKKKDTGLKDILKLGTTNIVGTSLIQTEAQLIDL